MKESMAEISLPERALIKGKEAFYGIKAPDKVGGEKLGDRQFEVDLDAFSLYEEVDKWVKAQEENYDKINPSEVHKVLGEVESYDIVGARTPEEAHLMREAIRKMAAVRLYLVMALDGAETNNVDNFRQNMMNLGTEDGINYLTALNISNKQGKIQEIAIDGEKVKTDYTGTITTEKSQRQYQAERISQAMKWFDARKGQTNLTAAEGTPNGGIANTEGYYYRMYDITDDMFESMTGDEIRTKYRITWEDIEGATPAITNAAINAHLKAKTNLADPNNKPAETIQTLYRKVIDREIAESFVADLERQIGIQEDTRVRIETERMQPYAKLSKKLANNLVRPKMTAAQIHEKAVAEARQSVILAKEVMDGYGISVMNSGVEEKGTGELVHLKIIRELFYHKDATGVYVRNTKKNKYGADIPIEIDLTLPEYRKRWYEYKKKGNFVTTTKASEEGKPARVVSQVGSKFGVRMFRNTAYGSFYMEQEGYEEHAKAFRYAISAWGEAATVFTGKATVAELLAKPSSTINGGMQIAYGLFQDGAKKAIDVWMSGENPIARMVLDHPNDYRDPMEAVKMIIPYLKIDRGYQRYIQGVNAGKMNSLGLALDVANALMYASTEEGQKRGFGKINSMLKASILLRLIQENQILREDVVGIGGGKKGIKQDLKINELYAAFQNGGPEGAESIWKFIIGSLKLINYLN